jgi:hypothetical protein
MGEQAVAYFRFDSPPAAETFVFQLIDPVKIQQARDILHGKETRTTHIAGTIVKEPVPYNPPWSYHLAPESIQFFETSIEVCDASIQYVEEHLNEVGGTVLPGNHWCPWGSRLLEESTWPPLPQTFEGVSEKGDFYEALADAIQKAKEGLRTDYIRWDLEHIGGEHGGFVIVNKLTVKISAKGEHGDAGD